MINLKKSKQTLNKQQFKKKPKKIKKKKSKQILIKQELKKL
jgi:hypothetical protein